MTTTRNVYTRYTNGQMFVESTQVDIVLSDGDMLIAELELSGVSGGRIEMVRDYLNNRHATVVGSQSIAQRRAELYRDAHGLNPEEVIEQLRQLIETSRKFATELQRTSDEVADMFRSIRP